MGNPEEILLLVHNVLDDIEAPLMVPLAAKVALKSLTKVLPRRLKRTANKINAVDVKKRLRKYPKRRKELLYANQLSFTINAGGS
jgi:hypothetical protein